MSLLLAVIGSGHCALLRAYIRPPSMQLFPDSAPPEPPLAPDKRAARIATLLQQLRESGNSVEQRCSLLGDATPILLQPILGVAGTGSVYGGGAATVADKLVAYDEAITDRISTAERGGATGRATAASLALMRDHVIGAVEEARRGDAAVAEAVRRLRGGALRFGAQFARRAPCVRATARAADGEAVAVAAMRLWVERVVVGLSLCPWAKPVEADGRIRYAHAVASDAEGVSAVLLSEIEKLGGAPEVETTIVVAPHFCAADFHAFHGYVCDVEECAAPRCPKSRRARTQLTPVLLPGTCTPRVWTRTSRSSRSIRTIASAERAPTPRPPP